MANPVGYTADLDPHGRVNGYDFHLDDGTSLYAFGSEADSLARDLDSMPDMRTADVSPAPFEVPSAGGLEAPMGAAEVRDVAPGVPIAPLAPRVAEGWVTQPGGQPGSVDVTPQVPRLERGAVAAGKPVVDLASAPDLPLTGAGGAPTAGDEWSDMINARSAGSPGVTPQQMLNRGAYVPSERVSEEVVPFDDQAAEDRANAEINLRAAMGNQVEFGQARQQEEARMLRAQQPHLIERAMEGERLKTEAENRYREQRTQLQGLIDAQRTRKVDPNKLFAEKGTLGTIGIAIAMALSKWSSTMGHTQDSMQQMVSEAIEHSIRAQESAIAGGQQGISNALGELERDYGDREQAKQALRLVLNDVADNKAREVAAQLGTHEAQLGLQTWTAGRDKVRADEEAKFRALSVGKVKETEKFTQPKAASGGGPPTLEQLAKREEAATKIVEARRKRQGGNLDDKEEKSVEELSKRMDPVQKLEATTKGVRDAGLEKDITAPLPRFASGAAAIGGFPKLESSRAAWDRWLSAKVAEESGAGVSEEEFERRKNSLEGALGSGAVKENALRDTEKYVTDKKRNILQGYSKKVRDEYEKRHGQVLSEEKKGATKAK